MEVKLNLNADDILEKVFKKSQNGYDAYAVDEFLDLVLSDYRIAESNLLISHKDIEIYKKRIDELVMENEKLAVENKSFKKRLSDIKDTDVVTTENIDLIKRINQLEKFLWKHGYDPNTIK